MDKKIIIVEDEDYLAEMYKLKFESEKFIVNIADNGVEGLELIKKEKPDIVLLDIVMPKMDGYEVLKKIRSDKEFKNLKVYILSNLGQEEEIKKGYDAGADGYFIKSDLTPTELVKKTKKILAKK